jgi:hypothetical protein
MPIDVTCGACGRAINAPDKLAGKKVKCPQCATIVAVPAPRSADTPPARPGPARPASPPPAGKPATSHGVAPARPPAPQRPAPRPPAQPPTFQNSPPAAQPHGFGGVGDLLHEELTRDYQQRMAASEAEFQRQQQEAIRHAFEAPKRAAEAMRRKGIHGQYSNAKSIEVGRTLSRSWQVFTSNFPLVMGVVLLAYLLMNIVTAVVVFVAAMLAGVVGAALSEAMDDPVAGVGAAIVIVLVGVLAAMPFVAWLYAGQSIVLLKLARGQRAQFSDLFRGGKHVLAMFAAGFMMLLIYLMPQLPLGIGQLVPALAAYFKFEIPGAALIAVQLLTSVLGLVLFVFSILLLLRRSMFPFVIVDKNIAGQDSLAISARLTTGNLAAVFGLYLVASLAMMLGLVAVGIGFLFAYPWAMTLYAVTFVDMAGE